MKIVDIRFSEVIQAEHEREYAPNLRYSLADIARGLEVSSVTVYAWWKQKQTPSSKTVRRLLRKFANLEDYRGRITRVFAQVLEDHRRWRLERNITEFSKWIINLGKPVHIENPYWRMWDDWIDTASYAEYKEGER